MAKKTKNDSAQFVRKETFWLGTLLALAVGFFGGAEIRFGSRTGQAPGPGPPGPGCHAGSTGYDCLS